MPDRPFQGAQRLDHRHQLHAVVRRVRLVPALFRDDLDRLQGAIRPRFAQDGEKGGRVISYWEKPEQPQSDWASMTILCFKPEVLYQALMSFLGLSEEYPIIKVGTAQMGEAVVAALKAQG